MRRFWTFVIPLVVAAICAVLVSAATPITLNYIPQAQFCFPQAKSPPAESPLCYVVPGNISPDPVLDGKFGYRGLVGANPSTPSNDVESPFDNYSWQVFVGLNWKYTNGTTPPPPANIGLKSDGIRVWQNWEPRLQGAVRRQQGVGEVAPLTRWRRGLPDRVEWQRHAGHPQRGVHPGGDRRSGYRRVGQLDTV